MTTADDLIDEVSALCAAVPKLELRGIAATPGGIAVVLTPYPFTPQTLINHLYDAMKALGTRTYSVALIVTPGVLVEELLFKPLRKETR